MLSGGTSQSTQATTIVPQDPPSQPCIKHLRAYTPLGVEGSVEDRVDSFHLACPTKGLIVVEMMAGRVVVDGADLHKWQAVWVIGYASIPNMDELLLEHGCHPPSDERIGYIGNCQVVHFQACRFCLCTALSVYLSVSLGGPR